MLTENNYIGIKNKTKAYLISNKLLKDSVFSKDFDYNLKKYFIRNNLKDLKIMSIDTTNEFLQDISWEKQFSLPVSLNRTSLFPGVLIGYETKLLIFTKTQTSLDYSCILHSDFQPNCNTLITLKINPHWPIPQRKVHSLFLS